MILTNAAVGRMSLSRQALLVLAGSLVIALAAQISVPFYPVPLTLTTFAVLLVGFGLGARLGTLAVVAYLAEGAMGLPVFANFNNGAAFVGPTAGFLFGYVAMAWIAGKASDMGLRHVLGLSAAALVASAVIYLPGIAWPMAVAGATGIEGGWIAQDLGGYYWVYFVAPFLLGDAVKAVLAALIVSGGWKLLKKS